MLFFFFGLGQAVEVQQLVWHGQAPLRAAELSKPPRHATQGAAWVARKIPHDQPEHGRSLILPTGHTSQGVTRLQGNHCELKRPSMVGIRDAKGTLPRKNLEN